MMEKKITVAAKQTLQADFAFDSPRGRRSVYEIEDSAYPVDSEAYNLS
jgi:hypothetical protein